MKISLNWLKKYVKVPDGITDAELIRLIGARLVEVEGVIDETHKYDNIYVVRVESCEKIPDTHLTLCRINTGSTELTQVVCGAPNVHEGMLAVWIAPGAIVPASVHEDAPFVIGKRKMRGHESSGMLAGADELDFGDDHSGIVEIDPEVAKPGDLLAELFELSDLVLEIENKSLTHRPDCFGIIGFAREVAGILQRKFEYDFSRDGSPTPSYLAVASGSSRKLYPEFLPRKMSAFTPIINIVDSDVCYRYTAVVMEKHGEIKKKYLTWVDTVLSKSEMRPIDPIVDATNYLMLLTGQPLHAFDYDKFVAVSGGDRSEISVRLAQDGEKIVLIDDREITLNNNDVVVCSGDVPVALAGAMGGKSIEIDENTKKIIIESATFSLYNLRKTQMTHGIFTEAITRFTKGQSPYQTLDVAEKCAAMLSGGFRVVMTADEYPKPKKDIVVKITTDEINKLLGTKYTNRQIVQTLENVGFIVSLEDSTAKNEASISVQVPAWRTDIHIKEDIIEEVGRLLGYDNIEPTLPMHGTATKDDTLELKRHIRSVMKSWGANELLTYGFVSGKLLERVGQDVTSSYKIVNSISPELQYVRQSIVPSLLDKAYMNQKMPVDKFAIYEMNKVYRKEWGLDADGMPVENMSLGFVLAERKNAKTAYYTAKWYVEQLLKEFGIEAEFVPIEGSSAEMRPFEPRRTAEMYVGGHYIGVVGEFKNSVRNEFKLAPYLVGFELDLLRVLELRNKKKDVYIGNKEKRDLTVSTAESYAKLNEKIKKILAENGASAEITPIGIYQPEGAEKKNISVHLEFEKYNEKVMSKLENI